MYFQTSDPTCYGVLLIGGLRATHEDMARYRQNNISSQIHGTATIANINNNTISVTVLTVKEKKHNVTRNTRNSAFATGNVVPVGENPGMDDVNVNVLGSRLPSAGVCPRRLLGGNGRFVVLVVFGSGR